MRRWEAMSKYAPLSGNAVASELLMHSAPATNPLTFPSTASMAAAVALDATKLGVMCPTTHGVAALAPV